MMLSVQENGALVRPEIRDLAPYQADCVVNGIKLDLNETSWDIPYKLKEACLDRLRDIPFNRYPDAGWTALRRVLAARHGVEPEQLLIGSGSSALILALMQTFTGSGIRAVYPAPSFAMYQVYAAITGATGIQVCLDAAFRLDPDMVIAESQKSHTGLVMLCNPNNPTGNALPLGDIAKIAAHSPCMVAVDEAYFEFHGETVLPMLAAYPNMVLLRTFSKAYGLAGVRVGYLIGQVPVVQQISKVIPPYNVNALSLAMAEVALDWADAFLPRIQVVTTERTRVTAALRAMPGISVTSSRANFLLFKTPAPSNIVTSKLRQAGIIVKDFANSIPASMRVTIGTPEENTSFLQALQSILTEVR